MRHKYFGNQLGRNTKQAKALYRSLTSELLTRGRIETTLAKAKSIIPVIDRVMNFAKKNDVAARREVSKILGNNMTLDKIFNDVAPKYSNRNSGYSRIVRLGTRFSDSTEKVILELVEGITVESKPEPQPEVKMPVTKKTVVKKVAKKTKKS